MTASEVTTIPTADEIVRAALTTACVALREKCSQQQRDLIDGLMSHVAVDRLGEQQLRQTYGLLRRLVTKTGAAAVDVVSAYTLALTWPRPPLSRNGGRGNPIARSKTVKTVRTAGWALAKQQKIPQHDHVVVR